MALLCGILEIRCIQWREQKQLFAELLSACRRFKQCIIIKNLQNLELSGVVYQWYVWLPYRGLWLSSATSVALLSCGIRIWFLATKRKLGLRKWNCGCFTAKPRKGHLQFTEINFMIHFLFTLIPLFQIIKYCTTVQLHVQQILRNQIRCGAMMAFYTLFCLRKNERLQRILRYAGQNFLACEIAQLCGNVMQSRIQMVSYL